MSYTNATKNTAIFASQNESSAPSFSNTSKSSATFANISKTANDLTWDEATFPWDDANGTWDGQYSTYARQTKNTASFSNVVKS